MIELPPNPPANKTTATVETSAAGLAKQQVNQNIEAVVVRVQLQSEAGSAQKPLYDILLQARVASSVSAPPQPAVINQALLNSNTAITQITPGIIQSLQSGKQLLIKTQGSFTLPVATQVLASLSTANGIVLKTIIPPSHAQLELGALKQLVPQQQSVAALLTSLLQLAGSKQTALSNLPTKVQKEIQLVAKLLPQLSELQQSKNLQNAVSNSGVFLETKIKNIVAELNTLTKESKPDITQPRVINTLVNKLGVGDALKLLSQRLTQSNERQAQAGTKSEAQPTTRFTAEAKPIIPKSLNQVLNQDLKQALNNLQQTLQTATTNTTSDTNKIQAGQTNQPSLATQPSPSNQLVKNQPDSVEAFKKAVRDSIVPAPSDGKLAKPTTNPAHVAMKHYQSSAVPSPASGKESGKTTAEQLLLPPLPGQIIVQAQANIRPQIKGDEMADALVSILLKQVKGALARITLHQLASQPQRQEGQASPQPLSFEIPFVHGDQAQVIQFRIEEENQKNQGEDGKKLAKRWVVQMGFDIEGLGPMLCQISLIKHTASVSFWAEWENTLQRTKAHFDYLEGVLKDMGLRVDKLQGHLGIPKTDKTSLNNQLVDIKT